MTIKLVSFDVWSTLVQANQAYKTSRCELLAKAAGVTNLAAVKAAMNKADDDLDALTIATGNQYGYNQRVLRTFELLGVHHRPTVQLAADLTAAFFNDLPTLTEGGLDIMLGTLKGLQLKIAVNSNTGFVSGIMMRDMLTRLGLYEDVDYGLFSDEIGAAKPSPLVFERLMQVSGFTADQILHVGDNREADYNGAKASGLHALWYAPKADPAEGTIQELMRLPLHPLLMPGHPLGDL